MMHSLLALALTLVSVPVLAGQPAFSYSAPPPVSSRTSEPVFDFYGQGPYRSAVPRPSAILGYEAGATHTTFRDQERVIQAIAQAALDRVRILDYGVSVEGRPLRLIAVSAPENLAKLDEIRANIGKLADPRRLASKVEEDNILRDTPVLTWLNHGIHGDETASFESVLWELYTLAASESPEVLETLKQSVVLLNPVFNPDGHERYVVYYNSVALGSPEGVAWEKSIPWGVSGRYNHFRFDLNRDKLAQSQPEVQQETTVFLRWNPQVFADLHGQPETYFFPPNSLPTNRHVDRARLEKWTTAFGKANATAFDRQGWAYVNRETFDLFYPGYLDSFTSLSGAIGMTYETDGGKSLARRRDDGTVSTLRDAIAHHYQAALTTVHTAARNREALLRDYLAYRRSSLTATTGEKMRRVVLPPEGDTGRRAELAALLLRIGVEIREAKAPFRAAAAHDYSNPREKASGRLFPAGSLVIDLAQPQGRVARAFLDPDPEMEPAFLKEQTERRERNEKRGENEDPEGYEFYDITGWALPLAYGVPAFWVEDTPAITGDLITIPSPSKGGYVTDPTGSVAYLLPANQDAAALLALRLLQERYRVSVAGKPLRAGGKEWPRGTFLLRVSRNPQSMGPRLSELSQELGVPVTPIASSYGDEAPITLGSETILSLRRPRVAVAAEDGVSLSGYGSVWHALARAGVPFTPVRLRNLRGVDLSRFNVLILPDGNGYESALGKDGITELKAWLRRGNVLLGLAGGGVWFTNREVALSTASPLSDEPTGGEEKKNAATDKEKAEKPVSLPGSVFRTQVTDRTHFLTYGYRESEIPVPLSGDVFLKKSKTGNNVLAFDQGPSLLSGFVWPNNTEKLLADTAYLIDEPVGAGHALLYLDDPTFRGLYVGLRRLFLNGILFGTSGSAPDED